MQQNQYKFIVKPEGVKHVIVSETEIKKNLKNIIYLTNEANK